MSKFQIKAIRKLGYSHVTTAYQTTVSKLYTVWPLSCSIEACRGEAVGCFLIALSGAHHHTLVLST